jgi:GntR family transcriptional regulator
MTAGATLVETLRRGLGSGTGSSMPLYRQLQRGIRQALDDGFLRAGDTLPSEREMADALAVSRVTVRKAIRGLVDDGLLTHQQGAGTFVAPRIEQALSILTSFSDDMRARGFVPGTRWLDCGTGLANPEEALALDLAPGTPVSRLYRLRTANGKPMMLERTTAPRAFLADPRAIGESLYAWLTRAGHRPHWALQRLHAKLLDDEEAHILGVPPASPALYVERRAFLRGGEAIEFSRALYRGDAYDFVVELRLDDRNNKPQ